MIKIYMFARPDVLAEGVDGDVVVVAAEHVFQSQVSARGTTLFKSGQTYYLLFSNCLPTVLMDLLHLYSSKIVFLCRRFTEKYLQ